MNWLPLVKLTWQPVFYWKLVTAQPYAFYRQDANKMPSSPSF